MALLQRVLMVEYKNQRGTSFSIDLDGREYWITARHILTGAKGKPYGTFIDKTVDLRFLDPGGDGQQWKPLRFSVMQPSADVDVVVLVPPSPLLGDVLPSPPATSSGIVIGGECEFLGFPYGGGWRAGFDKDPGSYWLPFIKRCGISGHDLSSDVWVLDGINNPGFSGGPVIIGSGANLKIAAVVSGYHTEPAEVIRGDPAVAKDPPDTVNMNSGFIIAYDISCAVDLIKKNPIGPQRPSK